MPIKIVFLGTPDITLESFDFFIKSSDYEVLALVTQKAKAANRGKKIIQRNITKMAQENSIPVFEPDRISREEEIIEKLKALKPDFFITFAFGQILSQEVIDIPTIATINLHASLLPEYRGANPIAQSIIDGKTKTGITTMKTVLELDAGDICLQDEIDIPINMNVIELMGEISARSPKLLDETLKGLYNKTLECKEQAHDRATFCKKMKKEEKIIDWSMNAFDLHNKIRGMYQLNTNHTTYDGKIIKVLKTSLIEGLSGNQGEVASVEKDGIVVYCAIDAIKLITLKPEGKGEMQAFAFANGARIQKGAKFI
ncbi:MAG: methionyl-tRNA formyltransferase [Candidatus Gastranaerophilales bacterium]|nr:methionyl-tRNA formyltransferase [Candidatus Gastranaerophilales bacterium]